MSLQPLLASISPHLVEARRELLGRWTETPPVFDLESSRAIYVDDRGFVVAGYEQPRAILESDDPRHLSLTAEAEASLVGSQVYFLDWSRQTLSWDEIFDLWDAWDSQGMIADCGAVAVPWPLVDRWGTPGWVAFRGDFDGSPLSVIPRISHVPKPVVPPAVQGSFLARAKSLRGEHDSGTERLPMIPFTVASLNDPQQQWPAGVA